MSALAKLFAVIAALVLAFWFARELRELWNSWNELAADRTTTNDDVDMWECRNFARITKLQKLGLADGLIRQMRAFQPA